MHTCTMDEHMQSDEQVAEIAAYEAEREMKGECVDEV